MLPVGQYITIIRHFESLLSDIVNSKLQQKLELVYLLGGKYCVLSPKGSQAGHFDDPRIMSAVGYRKIIGWSFILLRTECLQGNQNEIPWSANRNSLMIRRHLTPVLLSLQHVMQHDITQHDTCMLVCMYIMTNTTTVTSSGYYGLSIAPKPASARRPRRREHY